MTNSIGEVRKLKAPSAKPVALLCDDSLCVVASGGNPRAMPGVSLQLTEGKNYYFGAAGAGAGAGRFMVGEPLSIAGGDAGVLP